MSSAVTMIAAQMKAKRIWCIEKDKLSEFQNFESRSPDFYAEGDEEMKWHIKLCSEEGYISAFLLLDGLPLENPSSVIALSATVSLRFDTMPADNRVFISRVLEERKFTFDRSCLSLGWFRIAQLTDITSSTALILTCTVQYHKSTTLTLNQDLNQDLQPFFVNRSGADISFIVEGKEIKAHKQILSARNPVFAAMLDSGMKEAVENRVEIKDLSIDTFEALLCYIYTDKVDLTKIDVTDLLAAANKYLLPLLKVECLTFLAERLTIENCSEMLVLADLHNAVHLKERTENFFSHHWSEVLCTKGWEELKQSRPELAHSALRESERHYGFDPRGFRL